MSHRPDLREKLLRATCDAPALLDDSTGRVVDFFCNQRNSDGGFCGRGPASDLYYTAFGTGALCAFAAAQAPATRAYLEGFGAGADLDFVHLISLSRCWVNLIGAVPDPLREPMAARLDLYRSADGGFRNRPGERQGSAYGAFLAVGALEDLGSGVADPEAFLAVLAGLRTADGGYANLPGQPVGITTLTGGVVTLLRHFGAPVADETLDWLRARRHPLGGFCPSPEIPLPDLLSTAVALHALDDDGGTLQREERGACLRFLDTVWDERKAAFCGHVLDRQVDVEYTWYGLLAAGHLAAVPAPTE